MTDVTGVAIRMPLELLRFLTFLRRTDSCASVRTGAGFVKGSLKLLIIFGAIIAMYVSMIISMYEPQMMATLDSFYEVMPELMASVGMAAGATTLIGFIISYLYGFILRIFPMVFSILRGNALVAKYVDRGSLVTLVAAPVKRGTIAMTQMSVLVSGILLLVIYATGLELLIAQNSFPGELSGNNEEALGKFDEYLKDIGQDSDYYPVALFLRAACVMQLGRLDESEEGFRQAMDLGYWYASYVGAFFDGLMQENL